MKKFLSAAAAVLVMTTGAMAQHANVGFKLGANLYSLNSDAVEYDTKVGFNAGLLAHIHLSKELAFQPELVYSAQGAKYNATGFEQKVKLGYINVPMMVQYMFDNGFRIEAGPQIGFLINAETETNGVNADIKDQLKTVDFAIGAGLSYVHVPSGFGVNARYNLGLSNILESETGDLKNRGAQIGVFYLLKHK